MSDFDRDRQPLVDRDPVREPVHQHDTTIIQTDGGRGRGSGVLIAVVLLVAVLALLFYLFGGNLNKAADEVNVNVDLPEVSMPDVKLPDVDVKVPDVDITTDSNKAD